MPRHGLWQYQVKAEPVLVPSLEWYVQASEPPRRRRRPAGIHVGGFEPIPAFDWLHQVSQPIRRIRPRPEVGYCRPLLVEEDLSGAWLSQYPGPIARRRFTQGGEFHVPGLEDWDVPISTWYLQASEPARVRLPSPEGGHFAVYALAEWPGPEVLLEWFVQANEPVWVRPKSPEGGHFAIYAMAEWAVLLEWYIQASEPVRVRAPSPVAGFIEDNWMEPSAMIVPIIGRDGVHSVVHGGQVITGGP